VKTIYTSSALVVVALAALVSVAEAYPQYQMVRDKTCTGCHISPAGGGLLNENGLAQAESLSQWGTKPDFFYGKLGTPKWLTLGGDVRGAGLYLDYGTSGDTAFYAFPMQAEIYSNWKLGGGISINANLTFRPDEDTNEAATIVMSREHYLMYRSKPDENNGLYVRAGRFMPVFGLRYAEHVTYVRRFGGTQLFSDTYGISVSHVTPKHEVHVTAFTEDPTIDPVEHANGAAVYGEYRVTDKVSLGLEGMYKSFTNGEFILSDKLDSEMREFRIGVTNKVVLPGDLLVATEIQFVNQLVGKSQRTEDSRVGGAPKGIVGNVIVSKMLGNFLLLDVGLGHFDSNLRIKHLDRDCIDINFHWFMTSHLELVLNGRFEMLAFGAGGESGSYTMLQAHYRL
jgi:hypothetical protein